MARASIDSGSTSGSSVRFSTGGALCHLFPPCSVVNDMCSFQMRKKSAALSLRAGFRAGCPCDLGSVATLWSSPKSHSLPMQAGGPCHLWRAMGQWLCFENFFHPQPSLPSHAQGQDQGRALLRGDCRLARRGEGSRAEFWPLRGLQPNT